MYLCNSKIVFTVENVKMANVFIVKSVNINNRGLPVYVVLKIIGTGTGKTPLPIKK